ncbi:MAG: hypothetical protein ACLQUW_01540 [Desulfobaccales bacterium]
MLKDSSISKWKDITEIVKSVFIVAGIIGTGYWFFEQGEVRPRADIAHEITYRHISKDYTWIHVSVIVKNIGMTPIRIEKGKVYIQQILPLSKNLEGNLKTKNNIVDKNFFIVIWPNACEDNTIYNINQRLLIEPGEVNRKYFEFVIPSNITTIKVYSYFENTQRSWVYWIKYISVGWKTATIYDIK